VTRAERLPLRACWCGRRSSSTEGEGRCGRSPAACGGLVPRCRRARRGATGRADGRGRPLLRGGPLHVLVAGLQDPDFGDARPTAAARELADRTRLLSLRRADAGYTAGQQARCHAALTALSSACHRTGITPGRGGHGDRLRRRCINSCDQPASNGLPGQWPKPRCLGEPWRKQRKNTEPTRPCGLMGFRCPS
jgi:hypothetical protein